MALFGNNFYDLKLTTNVDGGTAKWSGRDGVIIDDVKGGDPPDDCVYNGKKTYPQKASDPKVAPATSTGSAELSVPKTPFAPKFKIRLSVYFHWVVAPAASPSKYFVNSLQTLNLS